MELTDISLPAMIKIAKKLIEQLKWYKLESLEALLT